MRYIYCCVFWDAACLRNGIERISWRSIWKNERNTLGSCVAIVWSTTTQTDEMRKEETKKWKTLSRKSRPSPSSRLLFERSARRHWRSARTLRECHCQSRNAILHDLSDVISTSIQNFKNDPRSSSSSLWLVVDAVNFAFRWLIDPSVLRTGNWKQETEQQLVSILQWQYDTVGGMTSDQHQHQHQHHHIMRIRKRQQPQTRFFFFITNEKRIATVLLLLLMVVVVGAFILFNIRNFHPTQNNNNNNNDSNSNNSLFFNQQNRQWLRQRPEPRENWITTLSQPFVSKERERDT